MYENLNAFCDAFDHRVMTNRTIYIRTYFKNNVEQFVFTKTSKGDSLFYTAFFEEFRNHVNKWNREFSTLMSKNDRIIDILKRAFDKHYENDEWSTEIWIVFIKISFIINEIVIRIHFAKKSAEKCEFSKQNLFSHEIVFE